jgi:hypothetical protein
MCAAVRAFREQIPKNHFSENRKFGLKSETDGVSAVRRLRDWLLR